MKIEEVEMEEQLHKRFTDEGVKAILESYLKREIEIEYVLEILQIKRTRFFELLKEYRENPQSFSIQYPNKNAARKIDTKIEKNILKELEIEKGLIEDESMPIKFYNYSYLKDQIWRNYKQKVSLPTIINRAKNQGFYIPHKERKIHDREVLTNYAGELLQHDSSHHRWSPYALDKWYLITTLDDYSRFLLYAELVERETTWQHILALESVFLKYGIPFSYYVDSHSIFRFVQGRDSMWRKHYLLTDEADTQWKQVCNECNVKVTYALSPQAKGKAERPYQWLQDRLVRTCCRENISHVEEARKVLRYELERYNYHQVHSTTKEIPAMRFERALKEKKSLFRKFTLPPPFQSTKDVFCIRMKRTVNAYRKISISNLDLTVPKAPLHEEVGLRLFLDEETDLIEVRFWHEKELLGTQRVKKTDLNLVHF